MVLKSLENEALDLEMEPWSSWRPERLEILLNLTSWEVFWSLMENGPGDHFFRNSLIFIDFS
jgi:hypothetical protein